VNGERVERLRRNHRDEIDSAVLYDAMASAEREERLAGVYCSPPWSPGSSSTGGAT
jgi:hypothetical protein